MTIEQEIREEVAWLEIDRLTERILGMKPRSFNRMRLEVTLSRLMREKINRENQTLSLRHNAPSSLKHHGPEAA